MEADVFSWIATFIQPQFIHGFEALSNIAELQSLQNSYSVQVNQPGANIIQKEIARKAHSTKEARLSEIEKRRW